MKKRQYLSPLAVSVAALLATTGAPTQASAAVNRAIFEASGAVLSPTTDQFILTRSAGDETQLADHELHASHELHESHSSHSSHYSGG